MKEKVENALPYMFISVLVAVLGLGAWLYVTKGDLSVKEYQIQQLEEKLSKSDADLKNAKKAAKEAHKARLDQFEESEEIIAKLEEDIAIREARIQSEIEIQRGLRAQIDALKKRPKHDYSGTSDAKLAEDLTAKIRSDHPEKELDAIKVIAAAQFFFTREVAEAMDTSLHHKFGLEEHLTLTNSWIISKEREVQDLKGTISDQNEIIDERNEELQSLLNDYSKKSSEAAVLQSQSNILRQLSDDKDDVINTMKRRQWVERGVTWGGIAAVIIAIVASK